VLLHIDADNDPAQELIDHWSQYGPEFPILTNCGSLLNTWGEGYIPHSIVLDPTGVVRGNWVGWSDAFGTQMHTTIDAHLNPAGIYYNQHALLSDSGGDGLLNPGESASLSVTLQNQGPADLAGISAVLESLSEHATVTQATSAWPDLVQNATGEGLTPFELVLSQDAPAAMDLPLRIVITADGNTIAFPFSVSVGARAPYWTWDCETEGDWTHEPAATWVDPWHLSTEAFQSGSHAWKAGSNTTGNYANHADGRLVSPPITLEPWSRLSFMHRMNGEVSATFPDSAYDGGIVELSLNGVDWAQLTPCSGGYNAWFRAQSGGGSPASHNFPGGTPCFSGAFDWQESVFDLGDYNGATVQFRFRFGSDNGGGAEGWYIDDLVLAGVTESVAVEPAPARPASLALSAAPNPFNPGTRITFSMGEAGPVELAVYNLNGQLVDRLLAGQHLPAGEHELAWTAANRATGVYLLRLRTVEGERTQKLFLLK
jgi:hypothetical protein